MFHKRGRFRPRRRIQGQNLDVPPGRWKQIKYKCVWSSSKTNTKHELIFVSVVKACVSVHVVLSVSLNLDFCFFSYRPGQNLHWRTKTEAVRAGLAGARNVLPDQCLTVTGATDAAPLTLISKTALVLTDTLQSDLNGPTLTGLCSSFFLVPVPRLQIYSRPLPPCRKLISGAFRDTIDACFIEDSQRQSVCLSHSSRSRDEGNIWA